MKNKQILPVLMLSLLLGGCLNIETSDSQQNVNNSESNQTSISEKESSSSNYKEEITLSNREREYNAQILIGEMVNSLAKQPGDIKKVRKSNQQRQTQEGKFLTNVSMHSLYGQGPEIKSLNEPLGQAFGMISYFSQFNKTDYSIFDTTFYSTYSRPIYDETGKYISSEQCYESVLTIRDFPNSEYKMIHIRYWSSYNYLILIDEEGHFSILSEYVSHYRYKLDETGQIIGLEDGHHSSFNIQGDDYFVGAELKTLDYDNDVESIKEEFNNIFEPNDMNMCSFLIEQYYNLYKQDNGTYNMKRLTNKNEDIDVEDGRFVPINSLVDGKDSYLYYSNLSDAFMEQNYDRVSNASSYDPNLIFDIEETTIKDLKHLNNLVIIPETITNIDGLLQQDITVEGTIPEHPYGKGLFIPSSVREIKDVALKGNILFEFSHIFVDITKEECPFVNELENSGMHIYYKNEFECISGVYLPKIQEENN